MKTFVKNERFQILIIAIVSAIGGQFKINPFHGDYFRIGLGVSTFLFFILLMRHLPYVKTGIMTGIFCVIFQAGEWMVQTNTFSVMASIQNNLAAGIYYVVFAFGIKRVLKARIEAQPLLLGGLISVIDFISNLVELLIRGVSLGMHTFHLDEWFLLVIIAIVRSYFVIGLYSSISISQMRNLHAEQEKRMEQMLNVGAGLYGESFYLKKSMNTIEAITTNSYFLYSHLKDENLNDYSQQALKIAQQIHEVKKDSQRILAGLSKLYDSEIVVDMNLTEILRFVIKANQQYSVMLGKQITIEIEEDVNYLISHYIPLLTVLNNLVANAVEAIETSGTINIQVFEQQNETFFVVSDSGKGIPPKNNLIIFEPGFTTKFNEEGIAATGIGLSHVRDIVHSFEGRIEVELLETTTGTRFVVCLPTAVLIKRGVDSPVSS